jgi:hypothetical protein
VFFSGLSLDTIWKLNFEAVKVGREKGNYSLKTNYTQTESNLVNGGSFTWTGHYREGFDMQLETITLGDHELSLAQNVFNYNNLGDLLSDTPIQQALEGKDTIMVGGAGKSFDRNIFKLKADATTSVLDGGDLYIWGIDTGSDVIDLSDFIKPQLPKPTVAADLSTWRETYIGSNVDTGTFVAGKSSSFAINLDGSTDPNADLTIHFMGPTTVTATSLEEMIARAYGTSV